MGTEQAVQESKSFLRVNLPTCAGSRAPMMGWIHIGQDQKLSSSLRGWFSAGSSNHSACTGGHEGARDTEQVCCSSVKNRDSLHQPLSVTAVTLTLEQTEAM